MQVGEDWLLTAARAAIHIPSATAVMSDLHLGYGEARQRGGEAVPASVVDSAMAPLGAVFRRHGVRKLVIAGDLFEAGATKDAMRDLLAWLQGQSVELAAVIPGNHDRGIYRCGNLLPLFPDGYQLGNWRVVHGDGELPRGPLVQGHEHPCFRWSSRISAPCYLFRPGRLIVPAFSSDAAGVNVLRNQRWRGFRCAVIAGEDVLDFGCIADLRLLHCRR
jgi:uncharacterized protein